MVRLDWMESILRFVSVCYCSMAVTLAFNSSMSWRWEVLGGDVGTPLPPGTGGLGSWHRAYSTSLNEIFRSLLAG